ncbi:MAG TPA: hypothetical protein VKA15_10990, partial [Isosphaeraceae bacterium]|nr:hypothetical protein [Isosphaeraceae bacterium]
MQSLGGIATFALSVDLIASSEPYQPAPAIPYTQVVAFGAFSKTSLLDFAQSDGVHANAGDGTFSEPTMSLPISAQLSGDTLGPMVAGSFGGNGGDDLAVLATDDSGDIFVEVLRNDGTGNFTEQPVIWLPDLYGGGNSLPILVAGHFTSGSYDDLAVAGEGPDGGAAVQLVLMQHDKSFQPGAIIPAGAPDTDLVTAHLTGRHDSNGRLLDDLVVASLYVTQIQVLDNEGGGQFERGQTIMPGVSPESVAAGRFTTQGQALDGLAIVGVSQSSGLRGAIVAEVLTNNGSGQLEVESPITLDLNNLINGSPEIVAANFSGNPDGVDDLAVASQDVSGSNRVDILLNTGSADFQAASTVALGDVNESVLVKGNFTGSGRVDLAAYGVDPAGNGHVDVFAGRGDGTFAGLTSGAPAPLANDPYQTQTVFDNPSKAVSGRFTIDGHLDLAVPVKTLAPGGTFDNTYDNSIEVFLGNGDGTFRAAPSIDLGDLTPMALAVGHFSGDQFDDIAVAAQDPTTSVNLIELLTSNGDGTFRATAAVFLSDFGYVGNLVSGKFSGGSVDDLAVAGLASDGSSIAEVVSRLSDGSFRPGPEIALGSLQLSSLEPFSMAVGHFTSSARDDFVVAGPGQDASGLFQYQVVDVSMVAPGTFLSGPVTPLGDLSPNIVGAASFSSNIGGLDDLAVAGGTFDSLNVQILFNHGGDGTFTPAQSIDLNGLFPAAIAAGPLFGPDESDLAVAGVDQSGNLSVVTL